MNPQALEKKILQNDSLLLIDVRSHWEFAAGHIKGAYNVPYWRILQAKSLIQKKLPETVVLCCEHGPRAWMSGAILKVSGVRGVEYLEGHMMNWKREGRPLQKNKA